MRLHKKTDIEGEKLQSTIGCLCKIRAQLEEFDDWIHIPLYDASKIIKDGNISEAMKEVQHKLIEEGIAEEERTDEIPGNGRLLQEVLSKLLNHC